VVTDMSLRIGYGTNGFANHRLDDALAVIADLGYVGVALTLDHHHLDPYGPDLARRVSLVRAQLDRLGLAVVIETGARYLLDPWRKHAPTLLDDDRGLRVDFLRRAIQIGADLGAEAVSCWAGIRPPAVPSPVAWDRLVDGCASSPSPACWCRRSMTGSGCATRSARRSGSASPSTSGTAAA
jgi:L-ribulose-5-phosphate 3-epimerase